MRRLELDGRRIDDRGDGYVIAEIGHNHQGRMDLALEMIRAAKAAGADAVKLQKRDNRRLFTRAMYRSRYDSPTSFGRTYGEHRERLEFGRSEYLELRAFADEIGISLFATAFDESSANFLAEVGMPAFKIGSGDLTNIPLIDHVAGFGRPIILSTGGGRIEDVRRAHDAVRSVHHRLAILQCTSCYPATTADLNLGVIATYRATLPDVVVGLSAHDAGTESAPLAYALGARIIEKHFTLDRRMKGTDHAFSLEPAELTEMVRRLRAARTAIGDPEKRPLPGEAPALHKMGKQLVAARGLPAGHVLCREDIAIKSPNGGLSPARLGEIIGQRITRSLTPDEAIEIEALERVR